MDQLVERIFELQLQVSLDVRFHDCGFSSFAVPMVLPTRLWRPEEP